MKSFRASPLLLNCSFLSRDEYLARIEIALHEHSLTHIVTLNAEMVVEAQHNDEFRRSIENAELKIPDGSSMLWAREYLGSERPARRAGGGSLINAMASLITFLFSKAQPLTGIDSVFDICEAAQHMNGSVCLYGGREEEAQGTVRVLQKKYPRLIINEGLGEADVLFVALGAPKQTLWIEQNRNILEESGVKIAIGIGGAFAMISGILPRAPLWMRRHHLEWLWRLILEPKRLKRIWNAVVVFPQIVRGYPH